MATSKSLPTSMPAYQFSSASPSLSANLKFNALAPVPQLPNSKTPASLVRVLSTGLNPVDYKIPELPIPLVPRLAQGGYPATPGIDFIGRIWETTDPDLKAGDLVVGKHDGPQRYGSLAGYTLVKGREALAKVPTSNPAQITDSVIEQLGAIGVVGLTALQCFQACGFSKEGDGAGKAVLINGASGGAGHMCVQLAKHVFNFAHIVGVCSAANADFVTSLGADEVIDYRSTNSVEAAKAWPAKHNQTLFDLVIDNVGGTPALYWACGDFLRVDGTYLQVGAEPGTSQLVSIVKIFLWPSVLGGGKRKFLLPLCYGDRAGLEDLTRWVMQGKIKVHIEDDARFDFEGAHGPVQAFEKLKTGRARGKIVIKVAKE